MTHTIHHYHPAHGAWLGSSDGDASPLQPDVVLLPAHATLLPPPTTAARQAAVFRDGAWTVVPDWRDVPLVATADGTPLQIDRPGLTPAEVGATDTPRPDPGHVWQDGAWVKDTAAHAAWQRAQQLPALQARLRAIDAASARPLRAIVTGSAGEHDRQYLAALETEAAQLRSALQAAPQ